MGSHRQRLLHHLPTLVALLRGEARIDSYHLMTSSCSLLFKDVKECAPRGVQDGLREMVILDHPIDVQLFDSNMVILLGIPPGDLEMEVPTLPGNLEMRLGGTLSGFTASFAPLLPSTHHALFAPERSLAQAV